jgi:hypothetical protein
MKNGQRGLGALHHQRVWKGNFMIFNLATFLLLPLGTRKLIEWCLVRDVSSVASVRINAYLLGSIGKLWLIVEGV